MGFYKLTSSFDVILIKELRKGDNMTRLFAIAVLVAIAFLFVRYNTNEKLQRWVIIALCIGIAGYAVSLMVFELIR